jgi:hypothetical protein
MKRAKAAGKLARWRVEAEALLAERSREKLAAKVAKVVDDWDFYDRDELYDEQGTQRRLARRIICEQMAALIGAYANAAPHAPEAYAAMMVEELVAANPNAIELEAACRVVP